PVIALPVMIGIAVLFGLLWSLALGGPPRSRLINGGAAAGVTLAVLLYIQLTDWWSTPNVGPVLLAVTSLGIALGVTTLSTGLENRRSLLTALTVAALGVALDVPMQWVVYYLTAQMSCAVVFGLGVVAGVVCGLICAVHRGTPWHHSVRRGVLTALAVAGLIFVDRVMQVWPAYARANAIKGQPNLTIGHSTPNLRGNFWVVTLDPYTHLILP